MLPRRGHWASSCRQRAELVLTGEHKYLLRKSAG
jgi:hypothetical protein